MGVGGADWLDRHEREMEEHPDQALDAIGIKPGMVVADVGAGTGYFTLRMARRVGPSGKVYANDIQPEMLRMLRQNAAKAGLNNIETVLGVERTRNFRSTPWILFCWWTSITNFPSRSGCSKKCAAS